MLLVLEISTLLGHTLGWILAHFIASDTHLLILSPLAQKLFLVILAPINCTLTAVDFIVALLVYQVLIVLILLNDLL